MASVCGLLVVDNAYGLSLEDLVDEKIWVLPHRWVICVPCNRTKKQIEQFGTEQDVDRSYQIIVEPSRSNRYRNGLLAATNKADYVWLFQPGCIAVNLENLDEIGSADSVKFQFITKDNFTRWRRTLVRSDRAWAYDAATAQWEMSESSPNERLDKRSSFRENPANPSVTAQWANQLQAQCKLLRNDPKSEHLHYEIALSYLRLGQPEIAYDWFLQLAENANNSPVHRSVADTMMAFINKENFKDEEQIELYKRALMLWPHLADTYFYLAEKLLQNKQASAALDVANSWFKKAGKENSALDCTVIATRLPRLLAQCHASMANTIEAIGYYNQALHINDKFYCASSKADSQAEMHKQRDSLYQLGFPLPECEQQQSNHFKIIVAFWNAASFLSGCVSSISQQNYRNYEVIFIDDVSTDGGLENIDLAGLAAYRIVTQTVRQGPLKNQVKAVLSHCADDDIVVLLDGDDQLADQGVLHHINRVYSATDCWVTIGQFKVNDDWRWGYARPILPDEDISQVFKQQTLRFPIHLRTHRAGILSRLQEYDSALSVFRNEKGEFFFYASDVAYCRVIMSLAGAKNIRYIPRILMNYNVTNPLSVHQIERNLQSESCIEIAKMDTISQLENYHPVI